jgi:very-short-patch-repair endonuclease
VSISHLLALSAVLALALAVAEGLARTHRGRAVQWPVYARPVLSEAERAFYAQLRVAIPQFAVLCQVQISRFVEVKGISGRLAVRNRYDRLSADFVVCAEDFRPLLVVELDDSSHDRPVQRTRDAKKNAVLTAAGVPVVRFRGTVSGDRIREDVSKALRGLHPSARAVGNVTPETGRKIPYIGSL